MRPWLRRFERSALRGQREDARREHCRVLRVVDADRRDGHARRHLHDREQRVEPVASRSATSAAGRRSPAARSARRRRRAAPPRGRRRRSAPSARARRAERAYSDDRVGVAVRRAHLELPRDPARVELVERGLHPLAVRGRADEDAETGIAQMRERIGEASRARLALAIVDVAGDGVVGTRSALARRASRRAPPRRPRVSPEQLIPAAR